MDRSIASGLIAVVLFTTTAFGDDQQSQSPAEDFARDIVALSRLVLKHHVQPPARQQLVLDAARALYAARDQDAPQNLAALCSVARTDDEFVMILVEAYGKEFTAHAASQRQLADQLHGRVRRGNQFNVSAETQREIQRKVAEALATELEGGLMLLSPKASAAQQQLSENRYVGTGIAAGQTDDRKFLIRSVLPDGPMHRAGIPADTLIISIDGWTAQNQSLEECVDRLRGPEGSSVALVIRRPGSDRDEPLTLYRGVVPRKSLKSEVRQVSDRRIAILRPEAITASLPHEIRAFAQEQTQLDGVLFDLRGVSGPAHFGVLLADLFIDGGDLGWHTSAGRKNRLHAEPGDVFNDLPMAVIADQTTTGSAAWLATTLHERKRAVSYGRNSDCRNLEFASFDLPSKSLVATFATSVLTAPSSVDGLVVTNQVGKIPDAAEVEQAISLTTSSDPSAKALNNLIQVGGQIFGRESAFRRNPEETALQYLQSIPLSTIHPKKS